MAGALMTISPRVPEGSTLVYDPRYGLGWADPRGWQAYFGHTDGDVNAKVQVYQSMVDYLIEQGITPRLISVEYPDAPFYRIE
jgi:cell division protein FtsQ